MLGSKGSRWFVLCAFMIVCASPTGGVAAGPVPEPPTCITVLPAITTECPSRSAAPRAYGGRDVQIAAAEFGLRRP
jgi:hypothetical protein